MTSSTRMAGLVALLERLRATLYLILVRNPKVRSQHNTNVRMWGWPLAYAATANVTRTAPALTYGLAGFGSGSLALSSVHFGLRVLWFAPAVGLLAFGILTGITVSYLHNTRPAANNIMDTYHDGKIRRHHLLGIPAQRLSNLLANVERDLRKRKDRAQEVATFNPDRLRPLAAEEKTTPAGRFGLEVHRRFDALLAAEPATVQETFLVLAPEYPGTTGELLAAIRLL